MRKLRSLLFSFLFVMAIAASLLVRAQTNYPDLPVNTDDGLLLFPNAVHYGTILNDEPARFVFMALAGEEVTIVMRRDENRLVPFLRLENVDGNELASQPANDLAGRSATIRYQIPDDGWYYVEASHDPATGTNETGTYELLLTGASSTIYDMLNYGALPTLLDDDRVLLQNRSLETESNPVRRYYVAAQAGEHLLFEPEPGWAVSLFDLNGTMLHEVSSRLDHISEARQWLLLDVHEVADDSSLSLDLDGTLAATIAGPISQFMTLTPTETATATPTATSTATPTNTATATATPTTTPTIDPNICNGRPIMFNLGDTVIVDFNQTSALRLTLDLYSDRQVTVAQAYDNQRLVIVDGPECFDRSIWFWQVHMPSANVYGWVPETDEHGDPFLCPQETPECRRFGQ